jgi:hypothetical protein
MRQELLPPGEDEPTRGVDPGHRDWQKDPSALHSAYKHGHPATSQPIVSNSIPMPIRCTSHWFMATTKLQVLCDNFKLRMFESQWSKRIHPTSINAFNIELNRKSAKSGKAYYKTCIQSGPTANTKVCDALMKLCDNIPTVIYEYYGFPLAARPRCSDASPAQ